MSACLVLGLHDDAAAEGKLSVALWAGIVLFAGLCIAGLLYAIKCFAGSKAATTRPCRGCGRFIDAEIESGCPFCGCESARTQEESQP